ncbi:MAG TPA: hypothetical protein VK668_18745 [Mucilaginibacter sp.]|nr:hypothetical protein [Mucilaginibacter sp.]
MKLRSLSLLSAALILCCFTPQKSKVIQIDISALLNARPVTTLTNGKLISWTKGIDGNGDGDGYLTHSAAEFNGDKDAHALPDKPVFLANAHHPEIALYYNNTDSTHYQARFVSGEGEFEIKIPKHHYSAIYLGLTSSEGPAALQFELSYADGKGTKSYLLPDYYDNVSDKYPDLSYVATDLAKWGKKDKMTEKDHHSIHLLKLNIDAKKALTAIKVKKAKGGYLMFWSATGVVD